jgi:hypothetical protein
MWAKHFLFFFALSISLSSYSQNIMVESNQVLIKTIMDDLFSPPVASRIHLYANVAAYEVYAKQNPAIKSFSKFSHLSPISAPSEKLYYDIAATVAFVKTGLTYIYTEDYLNAFLAEKEKLWARKDQAIVKNSITYGEAVAKQIIEWSKGDNYGYTRTLQRYVLSDTSGAWQQTPPEYKNGLEPNWYMMRQIVLPTDSFLPFKHHDYYSEDKNSRCYKLMDSVYRKSKNLPSTEKTIALYWDDNPATTHSKGHTMYVEKKPSPLGHWLKITGQNIRTRKVSNEQASIIYARVCVAAYDAFINCWNVKYKLNTIRPETYIHRLIDPDFKPLIETPPFPEYTSGHSTVSGSVATVLDYSFPKIGRFTDSSQVMLGMKPRSFTSFRQAANEASISRFYGGIHIMTALKEGERMGKVIGEQTWKVMK